MKAISKSLLCCGITLFLGLSVFAQQESGLQKGIRLYREGAFTESATVLKEVIKSSPGNTAWTYLGDVLANSGKEPEAVDAFTNAERFKFNKDDDIVDKAFRITKNSKPDKVEVGSVKFAVELRKDGTIGFILPVYVSASKTYVESCVKALRKLKFDPAEKAGQPITLVRIVEYSTR